MFVLVYNSGGTEVTVRGGGLDSVAEPRITLTVVITRFDNDTGSSTSVNNTRSEVLLLMMYSIAKVVLLNLCLNCNVEGTNWMSSHIHISDSR